MIFDIKEKFIILPHTIFSLLAILATNIPQRLKTFFLGPGLHIYLNMLLEFELVKMNLKLLRKYKSYKIYSILYKKLQLLKLNSL